MIDIGDAIHYLIGLIIVAFLVWTLIQIHNYFSKDNIPLEVLLSTNKMM